MPERKRLFGSCAYESNLSQMLRNSTVNRLGCIQKWPRKPGPLIQSMIGAGRDVSTQTAPETACLKASNPETGKVAIAHCDTRRAHQQAIDRGHQAAEQGGGRRESDSNSLGHFSPLSWQAAGRPPRCLLPIYVYQIPL